MREGLEIVDFCGSSLALVREAAVRRHLTLADAIADLRQALASAAGVANLPRIRVDSREEGRAWLHTLRSGLAAWNVAGGKDYTSIDFETPAMWATVVDTSTGRLKALVEAIYLSSIRAGAVTALATDLLAPRDVSCLAQFGAGKIAQHLVEGVLLVRPSIRKVLLVRRRPDAGAPEWLSAVGAAVDARMVSAEEALAEADIVTTATSSKTPVIPAGAVLPRLRHLNLIGSNHLKRREIHLDLARRCLAPGGFLVVDDAEQAAAEAGDFADLAAEGMLRWEEIPSLGQIVENPARRSATAGASLTAFKSVGIGLMDLIVAAGMLRRIEVGGPAGSRPPVVGVDQGGSS